MSCHRIDARETQRNAAAVRLAVVRDELSRAAELRAEERRLEAQLDGAASAGPRGGPLQPPSGTPVSQAGRCRERWGAMTGDDRVRRCSRCRSQVYDLGGLSSDESERVLEAHGDASAPRLFQREDGTVLSADCPVGRPRKVARAIVATTALTVAALTLAALVGLSARSTAEPAAGRAAVAVGAASEQLGARVWQAYGPRLEALAREMGYFGGPLAGT